MPAQKLLLVHVDVPSTEILWLDHLWVSEQRDCDNAYVNKVRVGVSTLERGEESALSLFISATFN